MALPRPRPPPHSGNLSRIFRPILVGNATRIAEVGARVAEPSAVSSLSRPLNPWFSRKELS